MHAINYISHTQKCQGGNNLGFETIAWVATRLLQPWYKLVTLDLKLTTVVPPSKVLTRLSQGCYKVVTTLAFLYGTT